MEADTDERLCISHMIFFMPGCNKEINVIDEYLIQNKIAESVYTLPVKYEVFVMKRNKPYFFRRNLLQIALFHPNGAESHNKRGDVIYHAT